MKKIVVVYPSPTLVDSSKTDTYTFQVDTADEYLTATNTDQGCLIIIRRANLPQYTPVTLAVFKEWIYWEKIK